MFGTRPYLLNSWGVWNLTNPFHFYAISEKNNLKLIIIILFTGDVAEKWANKC